MKVGKTTFIYALLSAILNGNKFLDFPTYKRKVLLLAIEEGESLVKNRLLRFGINPDDPNLTVHVWTLPYTELSLVRQFVRDNGIELVIIDTLSKLWGPVVDDENDNAKVQRAVEPLLSMVREEGIGLLAIHHDSKGGGEGGRQVRGASSLLALVDQCLLLNRVGPVGSRERRLNCIGRFDSTPQSMAIELDGETDNFVLKFKGEEYEGDATQKKVKAVLAVKKGLTLDELQTESGLSRRKLERLLQPSPSWIRIEGTGKRNDSYRYFLEE